MHSRFMLFVVAEQREDLVVMWHIFFAKACKHAFAQSGILYNRVMI